MGLKKLLIILILISLVLLPATPALAEEATGSDIAKQLMCMCPDCSMILANCDCGFQEQMVALIKQKLSQGQSAEEIIQSFVDQYGERVLASPPKRGFNLVAWLLPFAAILGGGGVIYIALKAWVKRGKGRQTNAVTETEEEDEEYRHRLEKELEEFTGRGFR